jgi:hypothetical protein
VPHDIDAERGALIGNRRTGHELDRAVLEDLALAPGEPRLGEALREGGDQFRLLREEGDQLPAPAENGFHLSVDVPVVQADRREPDTRGLRRLLQALL